MGASIVPALVAVLAAAQTSLAAASAATDSTQLLALHERVMGAHRKSDVALLMQDESEANVVAGRGEVSHPTMKERSDRLGGYFGRTRFSTYRDLIEPIVRVSKDGTMGWVIVQIEAQGVQKDDDGTETKLEFVSAWIELYEKRDGRWWRTGNVSNFKP